MRDVLALSYHAVSDTWPAALAVTPAAFDAQLAFLTRRGFRGATFADAVLDPPHRRTLSITFDDAYRSVLHVAKPILDRHGLVATVFAPTGYLDRDEPMAWPGIDRWLGGPHEPELHPLSWDELGALAAAGWEVGSHTLSHPRLTGCDDARLEDELAGSRQAIEQRLGLPCRSVAYPFGDHDGRVVAAARAAGYAAAGTVPERLVAGDPLAWPRIGIYRSDGGVAFRCKVSRVVRAARTGPGWPLAGRAIRTVRMWSRRPADTVDAASE